MADEELERRVRKLRVESAETRWLALRLDDDVQEIRRELTSVNGNLTYLIDRSDEHTDKLDAQAATLDAHGATLNEHGGKLDSIDAQLRSLTQLVGEVLNRLPELPGSEEKS